MFRHTFTLSNRLGLSVSSFKFLNGQCRSWTSTKNKKRMKVFTDAVNFVQEAAGCDFKWETVSEKAVCSIALCVDPEKKQYLPVKIKGSYSYKKQRKNYTSNIFTFNDLTNVTRVSDWNGLVLLVGLPDEDFEQPLFWHVSNEEIFGNKDNPRYKIIITYNQ